MGNRTHCSNYQGISFLSTTHNTVSNILLSTLDPYAVEITGRDHDRFWHNSSITDHTIAKYSTWGKKWKYDELHKLFTDFNKAHDSVRREVLCNFHLDCDIHTKLKHLIKMSLKIRSRRTSVWHVSCYKQFDTNTYFNTILFNSASEYAINTFTAKIDHSRFNNSRLRLPASTLVDLIFRSCSFSLGGKLVQQLQYI
jgi:hypothetical protein